MVSSSITVSSHLLTFSFFLYFITLVTAGLTLGLLLVLCSGSASQSFWGILWDVRIEFRVSCASQVIYTLYSMWAHFSLFLVLLFQPAHMLVFVKTLYLIVSHIWKGFIPNHLHNWFHLIFFKLHFWYSNNDLWLLT